jgi:hypothetical protein
LFNSTTDDLSNSLDVIDIGDGKADWELRMTLGRLDEVVETVDNGESSGLLLGTDIGGPTLVPWGLV